MATRDLTDLYRRMINSNHRLQQLKEMGAPNIVVRNENRILQDAIDTLLTNDEIARVITDIGTNAFTDYFNYIAGTDIRFPIAATAMASHAV